jgi:superfamily II DNA or RNA helicase
VVYLQISKKGWFVLAKILKIQKVKKSNIVYNLHIEDNHNYFANNLLVKNCHGAKAKSLTGILEKMSNTKYRFGTTGTLDGTETNKLVIEGLLGPVHRVVTTEKLIKTEVLANFNVNCVLLKWPEHVSEVVSQYTYQEEIDWIVTNEKRNKIIVDLATKKKGNNLVLVNFVDKHAEVLLEMLKKATDRPIYYVHGGISAEIRNEYRAQIEQETDAIILATTKAFATGTNIKKLNNIFFCHPSKSRITTLQAIGRVLRRSEEKTSAVLYDIVDDLSYGKKQNFSMRHFFERLKIYVSEQFPYTIKKYGYGKDSNE